MLSKKDIICPENLLKKAKTKGPAKAVIVNAVKPVSIESAKQAVDANLIIPVFIGDKSIIEKNAKQLNWDISKYEIEPKSKFEFKIGDDGIYDVTGG